MVVMLVFRINVQVPAVEQVVVLFGTAERYQEQLQQM